MVAEQFDHLIEADAIVARCPCVAGSAVQQIAFDRQRSDECANDQAIHPVLQRILALTAAIWHNDHTGQPVMRSLTAYDHY